MKSKSTSSLFLALAILVGSDALALTIDAQTLINLSIKQISYGTDKITVTYNNNSTAVFTVTSTKVTWSSDHLIKTTTYLTTDKSTYSSVTVVAAPQLPVITAGTNANGAQKTTVATYGDGYVLTTSYKDGLQTITDNKGAAPKTATVQGVVTWSADHLTKTTTYTFTDGTQNPILTTVLPTQQGVAYTAPSYTNLSTTGAVTKPSVTPLTNFYGDGTTITLEAGTTSLPFNQSTLSALNITDPNAIVKAPSSTIYDLTWGTPDRFGPSYASLFNNGSSALTFSLPINIWGNSVAGYSLSKGPTYSAPHPDVISAWNNGWTGKGVNVVIADNLLQNHGVVVTSLVARYAYGATYYGIPLDYDMYKNTGNVFNINGAFANLSVNQKVGVINTSFGANYSYGTSDSQRAIVDNSMSILRSNWLNIMNGISGYVYKGLDLTDAVLVKSAGNNTITADKESFVKSYAYDLNISKRLLVVGALSYDSNNKGYISSYSNTAGTDNKISTRFVVASGATPFNYGDISVNGILVPSTDLGSNMGTSYAAPRIAGYTAILRQKFPNLNAELTTNIILQTATYETLACNPNCDKTVYGQGAASLSRALAPVGRLK